MKRKSVPLVSGRAGSLEAGTLIDDRPLSSRNQIERRVSVELLHVYASEIVPAPSLPGIELARELTVGWDRSDFLVCALVDDYSKGDVGFDWDAYISHELFDGVRFDYWSYESLLVEYAAQMFDFLGDCRESRSERKYFSQRGKYSCSFLTAIWYCVRAGSFESRVALRGCGEAVLFAESHTLVNVLPRATVATEVLAERLVQLALGEAAPEIFNHYY